ncbi:nucleolar protein 12 isoform X2 [Halyomorpha halys]|uniref:nucleolar protein 12 isoform X2 n=1 Tax=Halyomorpha halys TaxID=286706 RepID=UPI000D0C8BCD|nr:nucleolar protein 12 isoform X2 [Halyomorpha halys]
MLNLIDENTILSWQTFGNFQCREFLTGFHKRKVQRRKAAEEEFKEKLKEEKKRIKLESREYHKKLVRTYKPIPVLEEQLAKEYKVDNATVSVLELDADLLAETNFLIGNNRVKYEPTNDDKENAPDDNEEIEELPGMELKTKKEVDREVKLKALKEVKKSKIFKQKDKMERIKQKKIAMRQRNEKKKLKKRLEKKKPNYRKHKK